MRKLKFIALKETALNNITLFLSVLIFSLLFLPFLNSIPYLDGNIDFVKTYLFHTGGFELYFEKFQSIHPPLKIIISSLLYHMFGANQVVFTASSYIWGIVGIVSFYFLSKVFLQGSEKIGTILFSINALFVASGIFGLIDYMLTSLLLLALVLYLKQKYFFTIVLTAIVLTKETGLLAFLIFLFIDIGSIIIFKRWNQIKLLLIYALPLLAYFLWDQFLKASGKGEWGDWIFADTASKGTFYTIFNNIISLRIFNEYAAQHFLQLLFLNFNWIIILISCFLAAVIFKNSKKRKVFFHMIKTLDQKSKSVIFIITFCFLYSLTVLTFQTYTIPRYALPLIPFIILWFSMTVIQLKNYYLKTVFMFTVFIFSILGLFLSVDPIANMLWGKVDVLGQKLYATNYHLSGSDGLTYNYQYLLLLKKRTDILNGKEFPREYCAYVFPDPNNDRLTMQTLGLEKQNAVIICELLPPVQE